MNIYVQCLRKAAEEIRAAGHAGWGNVCEDAAEEILSLEAYLRDARAGRWPDIADLLNRQNAELAELRAKLASPADGGDEHG